MAKIEAGSDEEKLQIETKLKLKVKTEERERIAKQHAEQERTAKRLKEREEEDKIRAIQQELESNKVVIEDTVTMLRRAIAECLFHHTARKTGEEGAYRVVADGNPNTDLHKTPFLYIHPASAVRSVAPPPKWVVYTEVVYTTKPFMTHLCVIQYEWVEKLLALLQSANVQRLAGRTLSEATGESKDSGKMEADAAADADDALAKLKKEDELKRLADRKRKKTQEDIDDAKKRFLERKKRKETPSS
jgi:hypothetical protein